MIFPETPLKGAYLIDLEKRGDERGFFARMFCRDEFAEQGRVKEFVQVNNSLAGKKGTLRGMHSQLAPKAEVKVVRCVRGALLDKMSRPYFSIVIPTKNRSFLVRQAL